MAGTSSRNAYFNLDNSGGSPTDVSSSVSEIDFTMDVGLEDTTNFGTAVVAKSYTATLQDGKFSVKTPWNSTLATQAWSVFGQAATLTFIIGPQGSTVGQEKITGESRIKSIKETAKVAGVIELSIEFLTDGTVTRTTF